MNINMHPLGFSNEYQDYNEIMQDSDYFEEEDYPRINFNTDDILGQHGEEEEELEEELEEEEFQGPTAENDPKNKRVLVEEFFRCLICYDKASKPLMCPYCSKFCCSKCFKKWLNEHNSTCPSCRAVLEIKTLVKVRFMSELSEVNQLLEKAVASVLNSQVSQGLGDSKVLTQEVCKTHQQELKYFCKDCNTPICSDCAMFSKEVRKG
jgi:RNA-binding protein YhbY